MGQWYTRSVLFVADVERSIEFYVAKLGLRETWRHEQLVAQVERDGCEIIVSSQWPEKVGNGMLFISLTAEDFARLPDDLTVAGVPFVRSHWGYPVLVVADPDGNELYFPASEVPSVSEGGA
jgi:catechol 2,3-dioxygenase-like lactoylglutathione lyase family enzyme